jgi:membrane-associated phospholipid phosphatase
MSNQLLDAGISIVLFLQNLGNWLVTPMKFFSFLGTEEFFLFVAPAVYWCLSAATGLRVGLALMISGCLNTFFKIAFHGPRPYWFDTRVQALTSETSFGIPSGHAQNAMVVWGTLAASLRRRWAWIGAGLIAFLIGLSRMVLGVHFPSDVVLGWLIGLLLLWAVLRLEKPVMAWISQLNLTQKLGAILVASLALLLPGILIRISLGAWQVPAVWLENALRALPSEPQPDPLALSGLVSNAGVFFGLAAGAVVLNKFGGFNAAGLWWQRLLRFPIGLLGVVLVWMGLGSLFPGGEYLWAYLLRYLRYALVGLWVSALAPWLFIRLRLATPAITIMERSKHAWRTRPSG